MGLCDLSRTLGRLGHGHSPPRGPDETAAFLSPPGASPNRLGAEEFGVGRGEDVGNALGSVAVPEGRGLVGLAGAARPRGGGFRARGGGGGAGGGWGAGARGARGSGSPVWRGFRRSRRGRGRGGCWCRAPRSRDARCWRGG